jgi:hypothetical protein
VGKNSQDKKNQGKQFSWVYILRRNVKPLNPSHKNERHLQTKARGICLPTLVRNSGNRSWSHVFPSALPSQLQRRVHGSLMPCTHGFITSKVHSEQILSTLRGLVLRGKSDFDRSCYFFVAVLQNVNNIHPVHPWKTLSGLFWRFEEAIQLHEWSPIELWPKGEKQHGSELKHASVSCSFLRLAALHKGH